MSIEESIYDHFGRLGTKEIKRLQDFANEQRQDQKEKDAETCKSLRESESSDGFIIGCNYCAKAILEESIK